LQELNVMNFAGDQVWGAEPVCGHPAPVSLTGFLGIAKAQALGRHALTDLLSRAPFLADSRMPWAIHVSLSDHFLLDAHARQRRAQAAEDEDATEIPAPSNRWREQCADFIPKLLRDGGVERASAGQRLYFGGHAGIIEALNDAMQGIRQGAFERCVVGGIDCCLEPAFLVAAVNNGLLKTAANPCGFLPGEAAAFVLLERVSEARARGAPVAAVLGDMATEREATDRLADTPPRGSALAKTIRAVLPKPDKGASVGLIIADLNGDTPRAMDWGYALVRLHDVFGSASLPTWLTAQAFGETGAATGVLSLCLAARAWQRGYGPAAPILIWLLSDDGLRGAIRLEPMAQ
jgi:3-oxoacyl-[acyl-carrier-protein] synthase-1